MTKNYVKDYPRPQFVRDNWDNYNGEWDFWFADKPDEKLKIQVPFTYETKMSGIGDETFHEKVVYERDIEIDLSDKPGMDYILHFEGSDYETRVYLDGQFVGSHQGAYERFSLPLKEQCDRIGSLGDASCDKASTHVLRVEVIDTNDTAQPRGKQRWIKDNFGCWYVQTTGIWKTVWGEYVPKQRIESVKMTPDMTNGKLLIEFQTTLPSNTFYGDFEDGQYRIETIITYEDKLISKQETTVLKKELSQLHDMYVRKSDSLEWGIASWAPEHPSLYDVTFRLYKGDALLDEVTSYTAMREIKVEGPNILLNGEPLYQRLLLDQGYWKDSHLTPPSEEALICDIERTLEMGFNGVRKHQKTEDERFLYWCDVEGLLVWGEVAAAYEFSDDAMQKFTAEWTAIVKQNYNHPCIITWTPFNESWGVGAIKTERRPQHFTESIYHLTKSIDMMRPVIVNDGWEHTVSDIITLHDYEADGEVFYERYNAHKDEILNNTKYHCWNRSAFAHGYKYKGAPVIISEYGGIAFNNGEEGWGYGDKVADQDAFLARLKSITDAIKKLDYVKGFCYTQITDVQQEINGLMDMDRNYKVPVEKLQEIFK